ncbi:hypothetical protein BDC45DRAFT_243091 [Circinella umbellata]|nr:hypothetical protein BDC45DRAFT_243091 [Circinella umbellata]
MIRRRIWKICSLSLIFDAEDKKWLDYLSESEIDKLSSEGDLLLPNLPESIQNILQKCREIVTFINKEAADKPQDEQRKAIVDALDKYVKSIDSFDPYDEYDESWLVCTLREFISLYRWNIPARMNSNDSSEMDFVVRIWSRLDTCFDNLHIDTRRDTSKSSSSSFC